MNCESVTELADLYLYGELESGQEEELEQHVHGCAACQSDVERRRGLHRGFDAIAAPTDPALLVECRRSLFQTTERKPKWLMSFFSLRPLAATTGMFGSPLQRSAGVARIFRSTGTKEIAVPKRIAARII